jgi:DNA polymerase III delta prime subunit
MNRRFFIASVGQPGEGYDEDNLNRCIKYNCHAMHQDTTQKGVFDKVSGHSICFLKFKDNLIAYGEVEQISTEPDTLLGDWNWIIKVNEWLFFDKNGKRNGVSNYGVSWQRLAGSQMATVKEITQEYGLKKMREIDNGSDLYKKITNEINTKNTMDNLVNLLKSNKNIILTGAPGTGKTYLAKQIAEKVLNENSNNETTNNTKSIMEIDWATYYKLVQSEGTDYFAGRLSVIRKVQDLFNTGKHFSDFSEDDRKYIAGTQGKTQREQLGNEDSGFFGQMSGCGVFASEIKSNNLKISNALDEIPFKDDITKSHFDGFVTIFENVFDKNMVSCASRLLAMKRPDFFVCINGGNKDGLKKDFDDKNIDKSFDNYWEFIQKIHQAKWWKNPMPVTDTDKTVASARVAFLDSIYYDKTTTTLNKIAELSLNNSSNWDFVQFHPSYDYTDFVEGLRPKKGIGENEIGFELKNGVFKDFCKKAKNNPKENYVCNYSVPNLLYIIRKIKEFLFRIYDLTFWFQYLTYFKY